MTAPVRLEHILAAVQGQFEVTLAELRGASRKAYLMTARHAVVDAACLETRATAEEIAAALGREKSTVQHAWSESSQAARGPGWAGQIAAVIAAARDLARGGRPAPFEVPLEHCFDAGGGA